MKVIIFKKINLKKIHHKIKTIKDAEEIINKLEKFNNANLLENYKKNLLEIESIRQLSKKECEKEKEKESIQFSISLLEVIDNLNLTINSINENDLNKNFSNFLQGIKMTQKVFEKSLLNNNIKEININLYNPNQHLIVNKIEVKSVKNNTISNVLKKGLNN
jgi:molecular chaperone GrpE (heat shock protein)